MKRLMVFALIATLGNTSLALAEESLLSAGTRQVKQLASQSATTAASPVAAPLAAAMQGGKTLQSSGLKKSTKWLIAIGAVAGFVGAAYAIDQSVEDNTPSTLGTRRD